MTPEQREDYLKKSGDDSISEDNLIENEHGFMSWKIYGDELVVLNVFGDGSYWNEFIDELAKSLGLAKIKIATRRSYRAYVKKFGYKLSGYILEKEVTK